MPTSNAKLLGGCGGVKNLYLEPHGKQPLPHLWRQESPHILKPLEFVTQGKFATRAES